MSAYSDYKYGLITLDQYRAACEREAAEDEERWYNYWNPKEDEDEPEDD